MMDLDSLNRFMARFGDDAAAGLTWWQTAIVVVLERTCAALDLVSSGFGWLVRNEEVGGLGCRLGLARLSFNLDRQWGGD